MQSLNIVYSELTSGNQKIIPLEKNLDLVLRNRLNPKNHIKYTDFFLQTKNKEFGADLDSLLRHRITQLNSLCQNSHFKLMQFESGFVEVDIVKGLKSLIIVLTSQKNDLELISDIINPLIQIVEKNKFIINCPSVKTDFISPLISRLKSEIFINLWERRKLLMLSREHADSWINNVTQDIHNLIIAKMIELTYRPESQKGQPGS
ncbi:MAG: hypothetical protein H0W50_09695 [Parachlamydiaceae bacterium]|nr:hypothetical protein [Parachlamydiaceae bacterium]